MQKIFLICVLSLQVAFAQQITFFRTYGNGIFDSGEGVIPTSDTGYVVAGITTPTGFNGTDAMLYKTDSLGNLLWWNSIGGNGTQGARTVMENGSGYILAGYQNLLDTSGYNFYLVQTDFNGDTLWSKVYGGSDWDMAYAMDSLQDGSYVLAGETYSFGNGDRDVYVIRVDQNGDTLWTRTFGGIYDDYARYVFTDRNNNIVIVGSTYSYGAGGSDAYFVHMNPMGDSIWTKSYGTPDDDFGYSGDMYIDGGNTMSFAFGYTSFYAPQSAQKMHFYRGDSISCSYLNDVGVLITNIEIVDHPRIRKDGNGKFYYCSDVRNDPTFPSDIFLSKTYYSFGFDLASNLFYLPENNTPHDIQKCFDNGYVVVGETEYYGPGTNASFIMKTDTFFVNAGIPVVALDNEEVVEFNMYPNPVSNGTLFIEAVQPITGIRIFDLHGRMVYQTAGAQFASQYIQDLTLSSGVYLVEITTTQGIGRKKLMVSR